MIVIGNDFGADWPELSLTVTATVPLPAVVGVPLITPLEAFKLRPSGRPVAVHVYGVLPPEAVKVAV